jgi:chorismate-pyruvate lyase
MSGAPAITISEPGAEPARSTAAALADHLLAATSVTAGLQSWCEARGIGEGPIRVLSRAGGEPPAGLVALLGAVAGEALSYRRVVLGRGGIALAEAELLYRSAALTTEMREAVARGTTPFGAIVSPLSPRRDTVTCAVGGHDGALALRLKARLVLPCGAALAAVDEAFLPSLLAPRSALARGN